MIETWQTAESLSVKVHVQPRASKNELAGDFQGALKVRLVAPPIDNQANKALIAFLAEVFGVKKSQVKILSGRTGRDKIVTFYNCDKDLIMRILARD